MDFRAEYEKWCTDPYFDDATKEILDAKNSEIRNLKEENKKLRKFEMLYNSRNVSNK